MKIMYVTDQLYLHGGVEKTLSAKINRWICDFGYDVYIVTSEQRNQKFVYALDEKVKHIDLKLEYDRKKSYYTPANLGKSILHISSLISLINRLKPDIIISPSFAPEQYILPFVIKKIPLVKEIHFSGHILQEQKGLSSSKNMIDKFFRYYDCVAILNEDERKYYPKARTEVIPNFTEATLSDNALNKENTVIAAGRIAPVKQFDHLIEAWALIAQKHPDWKLKIFGEGDEELLNKLKTLAEKKGVAKSVEFPGAVQSLSSELQKSKIFALTSETECFPMVLLESKAAGLPVVSYDCPNGPRHIVKDGEDGLLVEDQNIAKFAAALHDMIEDEGRRLAMGENAVINSQTFSVENVMKMWDHLFRKLIYDKKSKGRSVSL